MQVILSYVHVVDVLPPSMSSKVLPLLLGDERLGKVRPCKQVIRVFINRVVVLRFT